MELIRRKLIYTTNMIESYLRQFHKAELYYKYCILRQWMSLVNQHAIIYIFPILNAALHRSLFLDPHNLSIHRDDGIYRLYLVRILN